MSHSTLDAVQGVKVEPNFRLKPGDGGGIDDFIRNPAGDSVYVETKLTPNIAVRGGRGVSQLSAAIEAADAIKARGKRSMVILNLGRGLREGEETMLKDVFGVNYDKIEIVSSQVDLYRKVDTFFNGSL